MQSSNKLKNFKPSTNKSLLDAKNVKYILNKGLILPLHSLTLFCVTIPNKTGFNEIKYVCFSASSLNFLLSSIRNNASKADEQILESFKISSLFDRIKFGKSFSYNNIRIVIILII